MRSSLSKGWSPTDENSEYYWTLGKEPFSFQRFAKVQRCKLREAGVHFGINRLSLLENEGKVQKYDHKPCEFLAMPDNSNIFSWSMYFIILWVVHFKSSFSSSFQYTLFTIHLLWWSCFLFQGGNRSNLKRLSTVKSISLPAFVATFYYSSDLSLLLISTPAMCTGSQIWVDTTPGACSRVYPLLSFIIRVLLFTVSLPPTYKLSNFPQLKKYKHKQKTFLS